MHLFFAFLFDFGLFDVIYYGLYFIFLFGMFLFFYYYHVLPLEGYSDECLLFVVLLWLDFLSF